MMMSENYEAEESNEIEFAEELTVFGCVQKGVVDGYESLDNTPIYVRIFNEHWEEIAYQQVESDGSYNINAGGAYEYHIKFECDGYLPFYLKYFGTGSYQLGSGESEDTITLIPGDTTYYPQVDNQWSDDYLSENDLIYVQSCLGAYQGDVDYNPAMDSNGDGVISQDELNAFQDFYVNLGEEQIDISEMNGLYYDINYDCIINYNDYLILYGYFAGYFERPASVPDFNGNGILNESDTADYFTYIFEGEGSEIAMNYNYDLDHNGIIDTNDQSMLEYYAGKRDASVNFYSYMDKNCNGEIDEYDVQWFAEAYAQYGYLNADSAYKKSLTMYDSGYFYGSLNLSDTNLNLNGCDLYIGDCVSFTTNNPQFWSGGQGATLNINGGELIVNNNLVFRTASPDGWNCNAGQNLLLNGGSVIVGGEFLFGQPGCYDVILMTNENDYLEVNSNFRYTTLADMEGKWTAGTIGFYGPEWTVNEEAGSKAIYSSDAH